MTAKLRILLGEDFRLFRVFVVWACTAGLLQGLAVGTIVPLTRALLARDADGFWPWFVTLVVLALLASAAHYVQAMRGFDVALSVLDKLQQRIGNHVVGLPLGWFTSDRAGSLSLMATSGTMSLASACAHYFTPVYVGISSALTVLAISFTVDLRIGLTLLVCAPLIAVVQHFAVRVSDSADARTHAGDRELTSRLLEFARCQPVLRAAGRSQQYAPLLEANARRRRLGRTLLWRQIIGLMLGSAMVQATATAAIVVGAFVALGGDLDAGLLVGMLALCIQFTHPLSEAFEMGTAIRQALHHLHRIEGVLSEPTMPAPEEPAPDPAGDVPAVEFENVSFAYTETPVVRDVSFTVPTGSMTALVGPSGSGKTTLTKLVARFHDVDAGVVRVGGLDVRDQSTEQLMARLALVFQDVYLFDDTLEANIRLGRDGASEAEVQEAARLAGVLEIVDRLPHGWHTRVGEGGTALSGGERQRVSIARALLKHAPIVLLDEATAALDPENERHIIDVMERLTATSTIVVIAHKLSTIIDADQIVVLSDGGRVLDIGSHGELIGRCELYTRFWAEREAAQGWRIHASCMGPTVGKQPGRNHMTMSIAQSGQGHGCRA